MNNKINKLRETIYKYLSDRKVEKGTEFTHISMGADFNNFNSKKVNGSYFVNTEELKNFNEMYAEAYGYKLDLGIAEKIKDYNKMLVDIDLKLPIENYVEGSRLYDNEMKFKIIDYYKEAIKDYFAVSKKELNCALFEKPEPTKNEKEVKDGFHLIFSDLVINTKSRYLIRNKVLKRVIEEKLFENYLETPDKIIDKAVISKNAWLLPGSKKSDKAQLYTLTTIYNHKNEPNDKLLKTIIDDEHEEFINYFSLQAVNAENATSYNDDIDDDVIDEEYSKLGITKNHNNNLFDEENHPGNRLDIITKAKELVSLLSIDRVNDYDSWIKVGWALHNVDTTLLNTWIEFSKRSPKFKNLEDCETRWSIMKDEGLTIRSLMQWARNDNYLKYNEIMSKEFNYLLEKSLAGSTTLVANAVHHMYQDKYVCVDMQKNAWYEFRENEHKWCLLPNGYTLQKHLSKEFSDEYMKLLRKLSTKYENVNTEEKELIKNKIDKINTIINKLNDITFKKKIMEELKNIYAEPKFEEQLDINKDLIGFRNGVYDLKENIFRDGQPDDMISMSTKIEYIPFSKKNLNYEPMIKFLSEILPNENVRKYFITRLSTCVSGHNKEQDLHIATGKGSNGKSLLVKLIDKAFGDYYKPVSIAMLTHKRNSASSASPEMIVLKGARIACFQETDADDKFNVGIMKEITGEDKITARGLFKEPIEFYPQFKALMIVNTLPIVPSTDDGTWRRLKKIDFNSKFVEEPNGKNQFKIDKSLGEKIKDWTGIFISYLINIYVNDYLVNGLVEPEEVKNSTNGYKLENDYFTEFYNERIEKTDSNKDRIKRDEVFNNFKLWFKNYKEGTKQFTSSDFDKYFLDKLGKLNKHNKWIGYKLKEINENEDDDDDDDEN
jgi:P4 family phage/plasmid primase-like protien